MQHQTYDDTLDSAIFNHWFGSFFAFFVWLCAVGKCKCIIKSVSYFFLSMLIKSNCGNSTVSKNWLVILSKKLSVIISSSKYCSISGNFAKIFSSLIFKRCLIFLKNLISAYSTCSSVLMPAITQFYLFRT